MRNKFRYLYKLCSKCAYYQTRDLEKANSYNYEIDFEVEKLIKNGVTFSFYCNGKKYDNPIKTIEKYFRPLFNLSTHRKIIEVQADDTHAVDFDVPQGTDVFSVSNGIITSLKMDSSEGGNDPSYAGKDNYIYIYNRIEERIYCYRHLEKNANLFHNMYIKEGQYLGKVGLTGYIVSPHLHFVIYKYNENKKIILKSMPIKFI
jgi:murein DD-endopeptidase MepM/ murein hydrolase activator NlpD